MRDIVPYASATLRDGCFTTDILFEHQRPRIGLIV